MSHNIYSERKIFGFPAKIESFRAGKVTAPIYVRIKPINHCNHACSWCVYSNGHTRAKDRPAEHLLSGMHEGMREADVMPLEAAEALLQDLAEIGTRAVTFSGGGEPLLYRHIEFMFASCIALGLRFSIITNGQLLSGNRAHLLRQADWVRVSMDYANAEQMVVSRNVPARAFEQVMANLKEFSAGKPKECDLGINFIVTRENHLHLFQAAEQLFEAGAGNIRFSPVYCEGFETYHRPIQNQVLVQLARIKRSFAGCDLEVNSTYDLTSPSKATFHDFKRCLYAQTVPVVGADLGIYACHNTAYSEHGKLGSLWGKRFRDVWFSEETAQKLRELNPAAVCRHECANHSKVELFNFLAEQPSDPFV